MTDILDRRIAELEEELAGLRRRKLAELQTQVAALQASLSATTESAPRRGRPPGSGSGPRPKATKGWASELSASPPAPKASKGWAAALQSNPQAFAKVPRKGRGRPKGKRVSDDEALARIKKLVASSGNEGISARKVSIDSGLFYPRVISMMEANFKKSGLGKWTRYKMK